VNHKFACDGRKDIALNELATERVFIVDQDPALSAVLPPIHEQSGGEYINVEFYSTIIAFVSLALGIGIVPAYYPHLNHLRRQGIIHYARLSGEEIKPFDIAIYLPRGKETRHLASYQRGFIRELRTYLRSFPFKVSWNDGPSEVDFDTFLKTHPLEQFKYVYYLTALPTGSRVPQWRCGELDIRETTRRRLRGKHRDHRDGLVIEYDLQGEVSKKLIHAVGTRKTQPKIDYYITEKYLIAFYAIGRDDVLVGMWMGNDEGDHLAINGSLIASTNPDLTTNELNRIIDATAVRSMHRSTILDKPF
jgi:hypothetical protein